jgi:hypothetical protein
MQWLPYIIDCLLKSCTDNIYTKRIRYNKEVGTSFWKNDTVGLSVTQTQISFTGAAEKNLVTWPQQQLSECCRYTNHKHSNVTVLFGEVKASAIHDNSYTMEILGSQEINGVIDVTKQSYITINGTQSPGWRM